ncbi:hypothetical protein HGB13_00680 [bacterium]|nr:hypothetical protein [bacterium]
MKFTEHKKKIRIKYLNPLKRGRNKSVQNFVRYYFRWTRSHTLALHDHISEKSKLYANWHKHEHHKKIHHAFFHGHNAFWAGLGIVLIIQSLFTPAFAGNVNQAVSLKEEWEQGTLTNLETEDPSGDLKLKASGEWGARVFKTPPQTIYTGAEGVFYNNTFYVFRGNLDNDFYGYNSQTNSWGILKETPVGVGQGASIASDGSGNLYAIFGGYTKSFYKYSVSSNTWTKLNDVSDVTGVQSSLIYANNKVYLLRANGSQDFFVYDTATGEWNSSNIIPNAAGNGANLAYDGTRYIYALRGNGATYTTALYRFDTQTPGWALITTGAVMPTINWQTDMEYVSGKLYIQNGNSTTSFYKCTISGTTCTTSATTVFPNTTNSGVLAYNSSDSTMYSLRGLNTYDFYRFNPTNDTFIGSALYGQPASATPIGLTTGADLIYDGNAGIYGLKGGAAATGFYYYNISAGTWSARSITGLPTLSYDTKAVKAGIYIYLFVGNATTFYRYNTTNDALGWVTVTAAPTAIGNGGSLAYPGSGDFIYAIRGGGLGDFNAYSIANNNWTTLNPTDLPAGITTNVGARIVANATDVYAILGNGNTAFYKYNIAGNSWLQVGRTPFTPYYGTDLTMVGNKIFALAGNYSFSTYEYNNGVWRKLQDLPKYSQASPFYYEAGPYNGASIESAGAAGLFATRGNGSAELLNTNFSGTNYLATGTYESPTFDLTYVTSWNSLTKNVSTPGDSSVNFQTQTSSDGSAWSSWSNLTGDTINSAPGRYIKVKITLTASTGSLETPIVNDYNISFVSDSIKPSNPTSATCFSAQVGGSQLTTNTPYKHIHPYCSWAGALDNESDIAGYYVYFGPNQSADPADPASGSFFTASAGAVINNLSTNGDNFLLIKTKDNAGNISESTYQGFIYNYSGVTPLSNKLKTDTADFTGDLVGLSANNNELKLNTKNGFWQQSRLTPSPTAASAASIISKGSTLFLAQGNTAIFDKYSVTTDTWNSPSKPSNLPVAMAAGGTIANGPGNYVYAIRGGSNATQNFYRFDGSAWTDLSTVAPIPGTIGAGSASIYDGSRYIYVMRGNGDDGFYRYDTQGTNGQWTTRTNINFGYPNQTNSVAPTTGSSITYDGDDTIYAVQGSYAGGFAKYTISTNTWTPLDPLPMVPNAGSTLSWDSLTSSLIWIPGYNSNKLYRFTPSTGEWANLAKSVIPFSTGTASTVYNGSLYTIRGGTTAFYQYNIQKDSWSLPTTGLFGSNYLGTTNFNFGTGSAIARDNSQNIYLVRGNLDNTFIKYNTRNGVTTRMPNFPTGTYDGASLTYVQSENAIYGIAGLSDRSLFKFDLSTNTWSEKTSDILPAASGSGSSLTWDGGQYIYFVRGVGTNSWYRYDLNGTDSSRWSSALSVTGLTGITFGAGSEAVIKSNKLYVMRGQGVMTFYTVDLTNPVTAAWSQLLALPTTPSPFTATTVAGDAFLIDGNDGYLYLAKGNSTNEFYRYQISGNSWTRVSNIPSIIYAGTTNGGANGVSINEKIFMEPGNTAGVGAYNDGLLSYINQTADTSFEESGVYTSDSIDLVKNYNWANLTSAFTTQTNTNVLLETASSDNNLDWSPWVNVSNEKTINSAQEYVINSPVARYIKVRVTLTSTDGVYSPVIDYIKINYYKDETAPANPLAVATAKTKQTDGIDLVNGGWANTTEPYFTLPQEDQVNGATDSVGGAGVDCYHVYFGTDSNATPSTEVACTTGLNYQFSASDNGQTHYLLVQAKDKAGNLQGQIKELFTMKLDINAPTDPTDIAVNPEGYTNVDSYTFTTSVPVDDPESQTQPTLQYRTGGDLSGVWFDFPSGQQQVTIPNIDHPQGKYRAGINEFFVRVKDSAGNVSSGTKTIQYKFGAVAPSPPLNLVANPTTNTQNNFTFTWDAPASYVGDVNRITYYYSINTEPTQYNTNSTSARAAGPGPFATQKEDNNFFVVAKDEAGNIDWLNFSKVPFRAETSAPAAPTDVNVNDISDKDANQYRMVISWIAPTIGDPLNFAGYDIYESSNEAGPFTKLANTSGTAYVHTGLTKDSRHYYYVVSIDKTNNRSVESSTAFGNASGRYKNPPNVVKNPEVTAKAKSAIIKWATSREANTTVEFGKTESFGRNAANPVTQYVTDHEITITGLDPGTKYYFKAYFTDPDGNIGSTDTGSFITSPAPIISGLKVEDVTLSSMVITWYSNVPSYGSILFGKTQSLAGSVEEEAYYTKQHVVKLKDLESGTKYYIQVKANDEENNLFTSDIYEYNTIPLPQVTNVKVENRKNVDSPTIFLTYDTNVETSTLVKYFADGVKTKEAVLSAFTQKHEIEITDMVPLKNYTLEVTGRDKYGNEAVSSKQNITTLSDTMPPRIEKIIDQKKVIGEGDTAETQLTVKITTNESSIALVEAVKGVGASNFNINSNPEGPNPNHTITLKLGEPGVPYTYRVKVKDSSGNETISDIKTIVVSQQKKSVLDYIISAFSRMFGWVGKLFQ